jgi:uncharacterized repeat protein (TIGR01451 family)
MELLNKPKEIRMRLGTKYLGFARWAVTVIAGLVFVASAANGGVTVSVTRRDLRPLPGVPVKLAGAVNRQGLTDETGRVAFLDLPLAGAATITPSQSGFRFEPAQVTVADLVNPSALSFFAYPTATDLAVSIDSDDAAPLVGGVVNSVITLRNAGAEAATDVSVGFSSLPGLTLEEAEAMQGQLEYQTYQTLWRLPRLDPGATAEVHVHSRATLPDANVLTVVVVEEMDQTDVDPENNSAELVTHPRAASARLSLALTIDPATVKAGETIPMRLKLRNDGPNDATQVAVSTYLSPGASLTLPADPADRLTNSTVVVSRLASGAEVQLNGAMRVRIPGSFTLMANVSSFEQQLPPGTAWPEVRADFTVQPAFAHLTLFAFSDPPNPRVGQDVNVMYVARNDGPDAVTGLKLYTLEDQRLGVALTVDPNPPAPPVPGPFVFGDVLPAGTYTYLLDRFSVKAAGDLTNYFTVEYQDQLIPNAEDHPELNLQIKTLPSDIGLSLDANPKEITVLSGDPVTIDFPVHNDGPQPAQSVIVDYDSSLGLTTADLDEVLHADRVERPKVAGYIDLLQANETVKVRKHFVAAKPGVYTNVAQIKLSFERPDLLIPIAAETIRLTVLPGPPPPDLAISVAVDKPQVNVGEYAIFIVTVTNRSAQPAFNVYVQETDMAEAGFGFETVRSYGPGGDDRIGSASERMIPRIEPGASYSMSRTMRMLKPVTIPYVARITGEYGGFDTNQPSWVATTEITGVQVTSDIALSAMADRTNVKNGDLVNFLIVQHNASAHVASHVGLYGGVGAGFQMLDSDLSGYGYYFDWSRPRDLQSGSKSWTGWIEIGSGEKVYSFFSAYTVAPGQLSMETQLSQLDELDAQTDNNLTQVQINSAPASARISLRQSTPAPTASVGDFIPFVTEIRNEGPDRVTGLTLVETTSTNLDLSYNAAVTGVSGSVVTSVLDSLVRLPPLEPGQNFIWQRSFNARSIGDAWHRVQVAGFDQGAPGLLPESDATVAVQPAQADLQLEFLDVPTVAQAGIPTPVRVRVHNLGPGIATRVKVAVTADGLTIGVLGLGPRATLDLLTYNAFQTQLLPGESATASFYVTPTREGAVACFVQVQQLDQTDPNPANNAVSLTLNAGSQPPIPSILRVRKVRTDFFDHTSIAEVEIDQALLDRVAPFTTFSLEASSNLRDWEFLNYVGLTPLAPVTFTDHAPPGVATRAFRLQKF